MLKFRANWCRSWYNGLTRAALLGLVAAVMVPLAATAQAQLVPTGQPQTTSQGQIGYHLTTGGVAAPVAVRRLDTLPQISAAEMRVQVPQKAYLTGTDPGTWAARKFQAARTPAPLTASPPSLRPALPVSPFTTGASKSFGSTDMIHCGFRIPADQALAVGDSTNGVLQASNWCVNVFSKAGVQQPGYPKTFNTFFGLPNGTTTTDPRMLYDWINHRYYFVMIQFDGSQATASSYWLGVSAGDDPTGAWCTYNFGVTSTGKNGSYFPLPDFPRMGQDRQAIYIASNIFDTPTHYKWEEINILDKSKLMACASSSISVFSDLTINGSATDSTQPINTFNPSDDPPSEYLVTAKNFNFGGGNCSSSCSGLAVWTIHSPLSSPSLNGFVLGTANTYSLPPSANQPGSANSIDTGDTRISGMAMYSAGSIYASLMTNMGSGDPGVILYQIQPFLDLTGGANDGHITGARMLNEIVHGSSGGGQSVYYATQQPDPEGNVTFVFNYSDNSTYASLAYLGRRASQATGTLPDNGIFLATGQAQYNQGRWGDYTAVAPGGISANSGSGAFPVMWFAGMYAENANLPPGAWGIQIGANGYVNITDN
jgi:hypothetical protein